MVIREEIRWENLGIIYADIKLINPKNMNLAPLEVRAMADSGALHLCIPEHVAMQFGLEELEKRESEEISLPRGQLFF